MINRWSRRVPGTIACLQQKTVMGNLKVTFIHSSSRSRTMFLQVQHAITDAEIELVNNTLQLRTLDLYTNKLQLNIRKQQKFRTINHKAEQKVNKESRDTLILDSICNSIAICLQDSSDSTLTLDSRRLYSWITGFEQRSSQMNYSEYKKKTTFPIILKIYSWSISYASNAQLLLCILLHYHK